MDRLRSVILLDGAACAICAAAFFAHTMAAPAKDNDSNHAGVLDPALDHHSVWSAWKGLI
jgi:hypothetical protein